MKYAQKDFGTKHTQEFCTTKESFLFPLFIVLFSRSIKKAERGFSPSNSNSVLSKIQPLLQSVGISAVISDFSIFSHLGRLWSTCHHLTQDRGRSPKVMQTTAEAPWKDPKTTSECSQNRYNISSLASFLASFKIYRYLGKKCTLWSKNSKKAKKKDNKTTEWTYSVCPLFAAVIGAGYLQTQWQKDF